MTLAFTAFILASLVSIEILYFKIATRYHITDKPNHRSSHTTVTIRGGGIIFAFSALLFFVFFKFQYPYFIFGLFAISLISFLDDLHTLNNKIRLSFHLLAVLLLLLQWGVFDLPWFWLIIAAIFIIGTINAYNFMDGINGITGSYSLLAIVTLYYINATTIRFTSSEFLTMTGLSLIVFNYFNFRKNARCFAGDVGSVSIAFIIVFFIGQLILKTQNFNYIFLLLCYGLDVIVTMMFRVIRKENIFEPHRNHFYQFMVNELKISHVLVSVIYFIIQLIINLILIFIIKISVVGGIILLACSTGLFLLIRFSVEGKARLLLAKH